MSIFMSLVKFSSEILVFLANNYQKLCIIGATMVILGSILMHFSQQSSLDPEEKDQGGVEIPEDPPDMDIPESTNGQNDDQIGWGGWLWMEVTI